MIPADNFSIVYFAYVLKVFINLKFQLKILDLQKQGNTLCLQSDY